MNRLPRMIVSNDYDALIEQALAMKDKEWFEELLGKKKELQAEEEEVRKDIGLRD